METALNALTQQIRSACADARPLRIRGGGSKDFYGESLQGEILDTRALRGIRDYEPSELVVTAHAGMPLAELEQELAAEGQYLAFEPPHFGAQATVGGMVAAGLAGPARAASGGVRDFVLGLQMLNGRGEHLVFGGQVMKNVAGYDVSRLMVGALGSLGLITEVSLKVLPRPVAQASLRFELDQAQALRRLNQWSGKPVPLNASCWSRGVDGGCLTLRLSGARAAVEAACRELGGELLDGAQAAAFWHGLREQSAGFFAREATDCLWRLSVPDTTAAFDLADTLVEWGGALRWVKAPAQQADTLRALAAAAGGSATLFRHADAQQPRPRVFPPLAPALLQIQRELKAQFDPNNIFNRSRLIAGH